MNNLTPEERRAYYRRAENDYNNAKISKRQAENRRDSYRTELRNSLDSIQSNKSEKRNLEKRLAQINKIIQAMDKLDGDYFDKANRSASNADTTYGEAIVCKGITRGNMKKSFLSKSKCADVNTDTAYSACLAEKKLLEKTIERIDSQIRMLDSKIDSLKSSIRGCNSAISDANSQMRRSNWAMNYYG